MANRLRLYRLVLLLHNVEELVYPLFGTLQSGAQLIPLGVHCLCLVLCGGVRCAGLAVESSAREHDAATVRSFHGLQLLSVDAPVDGLTADTQPAGCLGDGDCIHERTV